MHLFICINLSHFKSSIQVTCASEQSSFLIMYKKSYWWGRMNHITVARLVFPNEQCVCVWPPRPEAVSPEKEDYYADILIYVTGCVLFILAVVIVVLCRMRMTTQKTLPTPPVQKLSKFPLKRQVTESRYKIRMSTSPPPLFLFFFLFSLPACLVQLPAWCMTSVQHDADDVVIFMSQIHLFFKNISPARNS